METKPPLPPFTLETAKTKVQAAEDAWNTRDPERVALAYTEDSQWRNRAEFFSGREQIKAFLRRIPSVIILRLFIILMRLFMLTCPLGLDCHQKFTPLN